MRRFLGWLGYLALLCATGAMAGAFAYATGKSHGAEWGYVFAAAVAALLAAESALAAGNGRCPAWLRLPALATAMAAVLSMELGFAASVFSDAMATRSALARSAEALATATSTEPVAVVRIELEGIEARNRGIGPTWCRSKDDAARIACEAWLRARVRLAKAEAAEAARARAADAQPTGDTDARAALLTRSLGGAEAVWADWLIVLLATAMSLARVACAAMLMGDGADRAKPVAVEPVAEHPVDAPQLATAPAGAVVPFPAPSRGPDTAAVADLPDIARAVLRAIADRAQPADPGQGYVGFVPPGTLSQRALADTVQASRRHVADALDTLAVAGVLEAVPLGREGTAYRLLMPIDRVA